MQISPLKIITLGTKTSQSEWAKCSRDLRKTKKTSTESTEYSGVYRIFYQSRPTQNKNLKCITTKSPIRFSKFTIFVRPSKSPEKYPPLPLHLVQLTLAASIHRTGAGRFANQLSGFCHRVAIVLLCGVCVYVCNHDLYTTPSSRLFETWFFPTICIYIIEILVYAYIYILASISICIDGLKPFALLSPPEKILYIYISLTQHFRSFWREVQNDLV